MAALTTLVTDLASASARTGISGLTSGLVAVRLDTVPAVLGGVDLCGTVWEEAVRVVFGGSGVVKSSGTTLMLVPLLHDRENMIDFISSIDAPSQGINMIPPTLMTLNTA